MYRYYAALGLLLLAAALAQAATYYVSPTGSDALSCAQAQQRDSPRQTFKAAVACLSSGDTLRVRGGTYTNQCFASFPSSDTVAIPSGTSGGPTIIQAEPGEDVWLRHTRQCAGGVAPIALAAGAQYIIVEGLNINGTGAHLTAVQLGADARGPARIIFRKMRIKHCTKGFQGVSHFALFDEVTVEHSGYNESLVETCQDVQQGCHGFYLTGNNNHITRSTIEHVTGIGITLSCEGCGGQVHDNVITRTRVSRTRGYGIFALANNAIYDSIIHHNGGTGNSVGILAGGSVTIVNNTIYGNDHAGMMFNWGTSLVRNNIVLDNAAGALVNNGGGSTANSNICNSGCDLTGSAALFVDAAGGDFRPAHGSVPSVNAANATVPSATPSVDYAGSARSSGGARDIGAYEFVATPPPDGTAAYLQFWQSPATTPAGQALAPPVQVRVIDAAYQLVPSSSAPITVTLVNAPAGAVLGGTMTQAAVSGVATFANLTVSQAGTNYKLIAATPGLLGDTSNPFTITAAPPLPPVPLPPEPGTCHMTMPDANTTVTICTLPVATPP